MPSTLPSLSPADGAPIPGPAKPTIVREQAILCPALGAIVAEGGIPLDARGDFTLQAMHDYLVKGMNTSEGFAGLCLGLGPFSNTLRDVLGNILGQHVNALDLREGMAQHPGDSGVLRGGQFDEAAFDALVSHSKNAVRQNGKVVDGTMTQRDVAEAIVANVKRAGTALAYTKGLPTSMFEFGSLLIVLGKRDPGTGERFLSIRLMRELYENKKLPPKAELFARPQATLADLSETMAEMAAAMPSEKPLQDAHQLLSKAFHEVSGAFHTALGVIRPQRAPAAPPTPIGPSPTPLMPSPTPLMPSPTPLMPSPTPLMPSGVEARPLDSARGEREVAFVPPKSVEEVLEDLNAIVDDALRNQGRIGYFAGLYSTVTATIRRSIVAGIFDDPVRMARLDVIFATRFLEAWSTFQAGGKPTASYELAFEALSDPKLLLVQHQLLALNAHILLDLGIACATVAPGAALPSLHNDFLEINQILQRFISMIEIKVGLVSKLIGDVEKLGMSFETTIIGFSLDGARDMAWAFAQKLAAAPQADWPTLITEQDTFTTELSRLIRSPELVVQAALDLIRTEESQDIPGNIIIVSE